MKKAPHGKAEIMAVYGNPYRIMGDDGILQPTEREQWEARLTYVPLPKPLRLSWALKDATRIRCHEAAADAFASVFRTIRSEDQLLEALKTYGGCYEFRTKRSNAEELSLHSWGIAIDLNVGTNKMGTPGDMHAGIVQAFEAHGFTWGGRWRTPDPMHFQLASGA